MVLKSISKEEDKLNALCFGLRSILLKKLRKYIKWILIEQQAKTAYTSSLH